MASSTLARGIDHLIYATPDLETGMRGIEDALGVRPALGGRHPSYGTRNALVALGDATYLEVLAPDPELAVPERGRLVDLDQLDRPRLATWVLRDEEIDSLVERAAMRGLDLGAVRPGSRERPDGTLLSWKLSDPYAPRLGGVVPFVIAWGETPHPATVAPRAGDLVGLQLEHPDPATVHEALAALGVDLPVGEAPEPRLTARIRTDAGEVELR